MSLIDRIVQLHPLFFSIDEYLKELKPIHLCWLFEKLGLPVPRYFVGTPAYSSDLIPTMTSNTAPSGVASADSKLAVGYEAYKCMDDYNVGFYCWHSLTTLPHWVRYQFTSGKVIQRYTIAARDYTTIHYPIAWKLQGSNNGTDWDDLDTQSGQSFTQAQKKTYDFSNVNSYTYYRLYITSSQNGSEVAIGEWELMESEPAAPSGCASSYVATNNAKCTWNDNSQNETNFRIEKDIDDAGFSFWKNVAANVEDSGTYTLGANHKIRFRVRSYNDVGYSAWSTSGYTYTIPTAPSGIALSWLSQDETIRIEWTDNSAYEQDFDIEKKSDEGAFSHLVYDAASPYDDAAPSGIDHRYAYQVRARCPDGRLSSWNTSGWIYSTPSAPTNCAISLGTINVTWSDNSAYEDGFKIERELDGGGWNLVHTTGAEAESWADASQPTETNAKYQYRVRAYVGGLYSAYSTSNILNVQLLTESLALKEEETAHVSSLLTESLAMLESLPTLARDLTLTESLALLESLPVLERGLTLEEFLALKEEETAHVSCLLTESLGLLESLPTLERALTLEETLALKEKLAGFGFTLEESLALSEDLPILERGLTLTESLALLESETAHVHSVLTESLALKEDLTQLARALTLEEALALLEEAHAETLLFEVDKDGNITYMGTLDGGAF